MSTDKTLVERIQELSARTGYSKIEYLARTLMGSTYTKRSSMPSGSHIQLYDTFIFKFILLELKPYVTSADYHPETDTIKQFYKEMVKQINDLYEGNTNDEKISNKAYYLSAALNLAVALEKGTNIRISASFFFNFLCLLFAESNSQIYATLNMCAPDTRARAFSALSKFGKPLDFNTFKENAKRGDLTPDLDYLRVENIVDEYLHDPFFDHYNRLKKHSMCISENIHKKYAASLKPKIAAIHLAFESNSETLSEAEAELIIKGLRLTNRLLLSEPGGLKRAQLLSEYQILANTFKHNSFLYKASLCMLALALAVTVMGVAAVLLNIGSVPLLVPVATAGTIGLLGGLGLFASHITSPMQQFHNEMDNSDAYSPLLEL